MLLRFFLLLSFSISLFAHQTGLSYFEIQEDKNHKIEVIYKKPLSDTRGEDITVRYPSNCFQTMKKEEKIENGFIINNYSLWCGEYGLQKSRVWVEGLRSKDRGVMIKYINKDINKSALLRATTPFVVLDEKSNLMTLFKEYVSLGVEHILSGYDHLLFVLSLILLSKNLRLLLLSITGFTLAHSITLAFGILGIITVGVAYIEAMIALSILFLARELMMQASSFTKQHLGVVAFIFGLLHGFGFATVLKTIGLPQDDIPLSLLAFNIGIELGQLLFIIVMSTLLYMLRKIISNHDFLIKKVLAYFIGVLSAYWLIQRVLSF